MASERYILWGDSAFPEKELSVVVTGDDGPHGPGFLEFHVKDEDYGYDQTLGISPPQVLDFLGWLIEQQPSSALVEDFREKIKKHGENTEVTRHGRLETS